MMPNLQKFNRNTFKKNQNGLVKCTVALTYLPHTDYRGQLKNWVLFMYIVQVYLKTT